MRADFKNVRDRGFSLVEVVIAVGVFALSILAVVGLLGPILESIRDSEETEIASNLSELIRSELERIPFEDGSVPVDIARFPDAPGSYQVLYGNRDLTHIGDEDYFDDPPNDPATGQPFEIGDADKFFRIELRNSPAYPFVSGNASEFTSRTFQIRVLWPVYRRTGPGPDDARPHHPGYPTNTDGLAELRQMNFFTTIRRK